MYFAARYHAVLGLLLLGIATAASAAPQATGAISGTVTTDAVVPVPLSGAFVTILTTAGATAATTQADALGNYTATGLAAGSYYVRVIAPFESHRVDELYNAGIGIPCPSSTCTLTSGVLVPVTSGVTTSGIDFALSAGGWFEGTITNEQTGLGVAEAFLRVLSPTGEVGLGPLTPSNGHYTTTALPPGVYYLLAIAPADSGLRNEFFENVSCIAVSCNVASGTPLTIVSPVGTLIDFALTPGATMTGTVRKAGSNALLPGVFVAFYAANGESAGAAQTNANGVYRSAGLPPGTYFIRTIAPLAQGVVDEVYDNISCPGYCVVTNGTAVTVSGTETASGIDFSLDPVVAPAVTAQPSDLTVVEGHVASFTATATGVPVPGVQWQASTDAGATWSDVGTATSSTYAFTALLSATGKRLRAVFSNAGGSATTTAATLTVLPCEFTVSPSEVSLLSTASSGTIAVGTSASCPWGARSNVSWLTVPPPGGGLGSGMAGYKVEANLGALPRTGTLTVAGRVVTVQQSAMPTVGLDRVSLAFAAVTNGAAFSAVSAAQTVRVVQNGPGLVTWTASSNKPWLVVSPASGSGSATLRVSTEFVNGLSTTQDGVITLAFVGASNSAGPIRVTLTTIPTNATTAPFGAFDTPAEGATGIAGSIAVTGWALDDVQVTRVRIERDPVAGEAPGATVFIGDASFVDGARPDVGALFPTPPLNTRAGWGYMMLTNFLPNFGNGVFKLYAFADDVDGHSTLLGTKTITCDNAHATNPFGAIDTPGQGATVSGIVNNFGWVLARGSRKADPLHGGTVHVVIDGAIVGSPSGWVSRPDLTGLFPVAEYSGIANALGVFTFDSTALTNGVHTISWVVADDLGGADGVGSRYFTVSNGTGQQLASASVLAMRAGSQGLSPAGRRGPDLTAPLEPLAPAVDGVLTFRAEALDRIELRLQASGGRLLSAMGDLPLPIGSRIDPIDGTFTWQPGPGFIGRYDLEFDTSDGPQRVQVILFPQGMLSRPQVVIDLPQSGSPVSGPLTVAGWALDPKATTETGIDTIHVWAYPVHGGLPIFLGVATLGGERPDVAELYGAQALKSGYGLSVTTLPAGDYDVAVFAWTSADRRFLPAATRRVIVQ